MFSGKQKVLVCATLIVALLGLANILFPTISIPGVTQKQVAILGFIPLFLVLYAVLNFDALR